MKKTKQYRIGIAVLSATLVFCEIMIGRELLTKQKEKEDFDKLIEMVTVNEEPDGEELTEKKAGKKKKRDLLGLFAKNSECIGWICIPDTAINYPVMHTPDSPQKYLHQNFYGSYSYSGIPFLDGRCEKGSNNLILYGHNMRNGTMFAGLRSYRESAFYKSHPVIEFETAEGCGEYSVFAVMTVTTGNSWYQFVNVDDREEFDGYIQKAKENSLYDTEITPEYGQQILTLSTCTGLARDSRLLVVAVKK